MLQLCDIIDGTDISEPKKRMRGEKNSVESGLILCLPGKDKETNGIYSSHWRAGSLDRAIRHVLIVSSGTPRSCVPPSAILIYLISRQGRNIDNEGSWAYQCKRTDGCLTFLSTFALLAASPVATVEGSNAARGLPWVDNIVSEVSGGLPSMMKGTWDT
ncbi:hypothetical protein AFLA_009790 [Aspergillus flavus NRRL3357]|nr:hypothetical protein AFLA_009790 [Aspergillus flavus NRRL3357]